MGNQLKLVAILLVISTISLSAQNRKLQSEAKGYLYYYCIKEEYNFIDNNRYTPYNKDYSGSYFIQMTKLPLQLLDSIESYYKRTIKKYRGMPQESSFDEVANMVCYSCWSLYEAKETKKYIKRIVKQQ
ncbi:hypothetical protein [Flavobacterium sp.]|uniref:hypothetical protein n=1 Tax=Flavobacterium sp. TaxID=239 RepID=UPI00261242BF|nr:hypothetical protein [Flavobacterium sp.]MDD3005437.1 hypothetical protein [Flavobacterium sp.]